MIKLHFKKYKTRNFFQLRIARKKRWNIQEEKRIQVTVTMTASFLTVTVTAYIYLWNTGLETQSYPLPHPTEVLNFYSYPIIWIWLNFTWILIIESRCIPVVGGDVIVSIVIRYNVYNEQHTSALQNAQPLTKFSTQELVEIYHFRRSRSKLGKVN